MPSIAMSPGDRIRSTNTLMLAFLELCDRAHEFTRQPFNNHRYIRMHCNGFHEVEMIHFKFLIDSLRESIKPVVEVDKIDEYCQNLSDQAHELNRLKTVIGMVASDPIVQMLSGRRPAPAGFYVLLPRTPE